MMIGPALYFWMLSAQPAVKLTATTGVPIKIPWPEIAAVNLIQQSNGEWLVVAGGPHGYATSGLLSCPEPPFTVGSNRIFVHSEGKKRLEITLSCPENKPVVTPSVP